MDDDNHRLIGIEEMSEMTSPTVSSSPESCQLSSINEDDNAKILMEIIECLRRMEHEYEDVNEESEYEEEKFEEEEMILPKVSTCINAADGTTLQGMSVVTSNDGQNNRCEFDVCLICFETWTSHGNHQICCLPCGHIYGMSCINKWLQSSGRCPECKTSCTLNDVRLLYATRLCVADHKAFTTFFPFTKQGFEAFRQHILQRRTDTLKLLADVVLRQLDVLEREEYVEGRRAALLPSLVEAVKRVEALGMMPDAVGGLLELLLKRADAFKRCTDALGRRGKAMEWQIDALALREKAYTASIDFFQQRYKEHIEMAQH